MYGFLLALIVVLGIVLCVVILLQAGKGGGLAALGGGAAATEGVLGGRQATTMLTRTTWTLGTIFMVLALVLSIMSSRAERPDSLLQQEFQQETAPTAPEPVLPGVGDPPGEGQEGPPLPEDAPR